MKLTVRARKHESSLRVALVMSTPPTITRPSVATSSAPMTFSNVVLPLPDGPSTTTNSPAATSRSTPASA